MTWKVVKDNPIDRKSLQVVDHRPPDWRDPWPALAKKCPSAMATRSTIPGTDFSSIDLWLIFRHPAWQPSNITNCLKTSHTVIRFCHDFFYLKNIWLKTLEENGNTSQFLKDQASSTCHGYFPLESCRFTWGLCSNGDIRWPSARWTVKLGKGSWIFT